MVNHSLLELVKNSLIMFAMNSLPLSAGRRARQLVPALAGQSIALPQPAPADDLKLFWMTFSGGLVFFLTFLG